MARSGLADKASLFSKIAMTPPKVGPFISLAPPFLRGYGLRISDPNVFPTSIERLDPIVLETKK